MSAVPLTSIRSRLGMGKEIQVSTSSVVDLKAELFRQQQEFKRERQASGPASRRPTVKKSNVWSRQNKGVESRIQRDAERERVSRRDAQTELLRKARLYDQLARGRTELSRRDEEEIMVDFSRKRAEYGSDSESDGERKQQRGASSDGSVDPWVEYVDEFGRSRTLRRSQLPPNTRRTDSGTYVLTGGDEEGGGDGLWSSDMDRERRRADWEEEAMADIDNSRPMHYDASKEIRLKGAGFYQFSADEDERQRQLRELEEVRQNTVRQRRQHEQIQARRSARVANRIERVRERCLQLSGFEQPSAQEAQHRAADFLARLQLELGQASAATQES